MDDEIQNPVQSLRNPEASDHEKKEAAANLAKLASTNDQHREAIAAAGGIFPLVALLESGSDGAKRKATEALANLAKNDQNQAAIRAAGGILPLVALVESGSDGAKKQAAIALTFLAENAQNQEVIASAGGIPALVALVTSGSDGAKRNAAWALANLSDNAQNREAIAASGGIPPLVPLVASPSFFAQQDAARTLGNLATVSENRGVIAAAGGIPPLVELITKGGSDEKRSAVHAVRILASDDQHKAAIAAAGAIPPLVALVRCRSPDLQGCAACVLANLAKNDQNKRAIVAADGVQALQEMAENGKLLGVDRILAQEALKYFQSDSEGGTKLGHDPARRPNGVCAAELLGEMRMLESGSDEQKAKAAEQLGTWAAVCDENRVAISREGGAEAMVALLVTGNDDMKCRAARALRNLANNCEAKQVILKAGGIATLELIARHGKGKVKEAADEALKLLSQKQETKSSPAKNAKFGLTPAAEPTSDSPIDAKSIQATTHSKIAEGAGDTIPTGEGTRVAMFSARFDGGPIEQTFRRVFQILFDRKYDILMVAADAGESFGDLTTKYLGRLHKEHGTMIAVCTKHYGEMTASAYSSHKELKFALDYEKFVTVLPLRVDDTYPPEPPGGPDHEYDKEYLAQGYILSVFKPSVVFLECREKSEREIAAKIASILQRHKVAKDGSN